MTTLHCFAARSEQLLSRATETDDIKHRLADLNIRYARIELPAVRLDELADQDEIIEAFRLPLDALMQEEGFVGLDASSVRPNQSDQADLHRQYMTAHAHAGIEGHLLLEGTATFYLRSGHEVHAVHCVPGDYLRVPKGLRHWFDMGKQPSFRSIRLYTRADALETVGIGADMRGLYLLPGTVCGRQVA